MTKSKKLICPLISMAKGGLIPCLEEKCRWYRIDAEDCVMNDLAMTFDYIIKQLERVVEAEKKT